MSYEQKALERAEQFGIIEYLVIGNAMIYIDKSINKDFKCIHKLENGKHFRGNFYLKNKK